MAVTFLSCAISKNPWIDSMDYDDFFRPNNASITNITAATKRSRFIKLPPILKISPISQNKITNPPNHLKKAIFICDKFYQKPDVTTLPSKLFC